MNSKQVNRERAIGGVSAALHTLDCGWECLQRMYPSCSSEFFETESYRCYWEGRDYLARLLELLSEN